MATPRVVRWLIKGLLVLIVVVLAVLACGLAYRAWRQSQAAAAMTIATPDGIDEATFLTIGNTRQWISIRGQDRRRPVVLMVHGGPGASHGGMAPSFVPWERDYVVAQWDQPGAGRTFGAAGRLFDGSLTIERMTADGIRVVEYLENHLRQNGSCWSAGPGARRSASTWSRRGPTCSRPSWAPARS